MSSTEAKGAGSGAKGAGTEAKGAGHSERTGLLRSAGLVSGLTLLSRVAGLARDAVIAAFFSKRVTDAFFVAFTIPNVLRRLLGEGALTIAFIPIFSDHVRKEDPAEARRFVHAAFTTMTFILLGVSILGVLAAPILVRLFAWGYLDHPDKFAAAVGLTRVMFPYIFFASLTALAMGVLNTVGHFSAPAASPVLLNLFMILFVVAMGPLLEPAGVPLIYSLALGVLAGGLAQLMLQIPWMAKHGYLPRFRINFGHPGVKRVARLMAPAVFGLALYQVNVLLARLLASFLPHGAVSYIYYAQRLVEFPMGVFAVAVATAAMPRFSEHAGSGEIRKLKRTLNDSLRLTLFIVVPSIVGLMALGVPLISAFFQRGRFTYDMTWATYQALAGFCAGLWAAACVRQLVPAFYALKDSKTPVRSAAISLVVYIFTGLLLMRPLQHLGLALAVSAASIVNVSILTVKLRKRLGRLGLRTVARSAGRSVIASGVMACGVVALARLGRWELGISNLRNVSVLAACLVAALALYFGSAWLLHCPELKEFAAALKKRRRANEEGATDGEADREEDGDANGTKDEGTPGQSA